MRYCGSVLDFLSIFRSHGDINVKLATVNSLSVVLYCLLCNDGSREIENEWIWWLEDCQINQDNEHVQLAAAKVYWAYNIFF